MTDDRFQVRRKPGGLIRVVDRKLDEVEVYDMEVQKVSLSIPLQTDADGGEDTATNEDADVNSPGRGNSEEPGVEPAAWLQEWSDGDNTASTYSHQQFERAEGETPGPDLENEVPLVRADHRRQLIKDRIDELGEEDRTRQVEIEELERLRNQLEVSDQ